MLRTMPMWVFGGLAVCLGAVAEIHAQSTGEPALSSGARVRLTLREGGLCLTSAKGTSQVIGIFRVASQEGIGLEPDSGAAATARPPIPWDVICRVEVSEGVHRRTARGALIGFGIGAALGGGLAAACLADAEEADLPDEACVMGGVGVGVFAGLIGTGIGWLNKTERWTEVDLGPPASRTSN